MEEFNNEEAMDSDSMNSTVFDEPEKKPKEPKYHEKTKKGSIGLWAIVGVLVVALALSVFTAGFRDWSFGGNDVEVTGAATDVVATETGEAGDLTFTVLNDNTCEECDPTRIVQTTEQLFPGIKIVEVDFNTKEGKALYEKYELKYLPAYLFTDNVAEHESYAQVQAALINVDDVYMINPQSVGSTYDPYGEKCDNGVDDNDDGLVDCDDEDCKAELACMEKKEVPVVDMFVMSHCPFGTQIEKGMIPVVELLGDKIDFNLRFVHYAMHGDKELYEELNQYCIQKEQEDKLIPYLKCFLKEGDGETCLEEVEIDTDALEACVEEADEEYEVTASFEDKTTWMGNFPPFNIDKELAEKGGVSGSPTLLLNGLKVETARDPASLLKTVCYGFDEQPEECDEELTSTSPSAGFGFEVAAGGTDSAAQCG
ncbi:hypothetical protein KY337_04990 [Candidatus Woesearchaeota archaeon]|nr:hypothetical protein [Candidatus Woesearchaeota archaeon]